MQSYFVDSNTFYAMMSFSWSCKFGGSCTLSSRKQPLAVTLQLNILSLIKLAQPVLWSNWCTLPCCFSVPSAEYNYIDMYMYVHVPALHMYMYVLLVRRVCTCLCMYHAGIIVICKHNRPPIRPQRCQPSSTHPPTTVVFVDIAQQEPSSLAVMIPTSHLYHHHSDVASIACLVILSLPYSLAGRSCRDSLPGRRVKFSHNKKNCKNKTQLGWIV